MRLNEEFVVAGGVEEVWRFFEEPEAVAACMPGVENVELLDEDHLRVLATQSIGPMTATFEADVSVLERVPHDLIRFQTRGRSVRGAVGSLRADNAVRLTSSADGTTVTVEGDIVLAGALGSVGQKVVARQARKVTATFAGNLQRALTDGAPRLAAGSGAALRTPGTDGALAGAGRPSVVVAEPLQPASTSSARWAQAAAVLSALSLGVSVVTLWHQRRSAR